MDTYRISNLNLEQEDINNLKRISTNMLDTFNHEQLLSIIDVMKNTYFMNELSTYLVDDNLPDVGTEEFNFLVLANKYKGNIIRKGVNSELDELRDIAYSGKDYLLKSIDNIQTIITCTGYDDFIKSRMVIDKVYRVKDNNIYQNEI